MSDAGSQTEKVALAEHWVARALEDVSISEVPRQALAPFRGPQGLPERRRGNRRGRSVAVVLGRRREARGGVRRPACPIGGKRPPRWSVLRGLRRGQGRPARGLSRAGRDVDRAEPPASLDPGARARRGGGERDPACRGDAGLHLCRPRSGRRARGPRRGTRRARQSPRGNRRECTLGGPRDPARRGAARALGGLLVRRPHVHADDRGAAALGASGRDRRRGAALGARGPSRPAGSARPRHLDRDGARSEAALSLRVGSAQPGAPGAAGLAGAAREQAEAANPAAPARAPAA